jgi:4-amino-4-deoxy-L-arabinose transferase-like glycosyltransferase
LQNGVVIGMVHNIVVRCEKDAGSTVVLALVCLVAFVIRVACRSYMGSTDFWQNGYSFLHEIAKNIVAGRGLLLPGPHGPVYPYFLALTTLAGDHYMFIVIPQALFGVATVACAFLVGKELFGRQTGLVAAFLTAFYPYYAVHDTALQETSMLTASAIASVYLLLRARREHSLGRWLAAGALLGITVLIRVTLLPFALGAVTWIALFGEGRSLQKLLRVGVVSLTFSFAIGAWVERNYLVFGRPVLASTSGFQFWVAHNPQTFSHYPAESIDKSKAAALKALTPVEREELNTLGGNDLKISDWFLNKGLDYVRNHPKKTLIEAARKVIAGFSFTLNPIKEPLIQTVYFISYAPIVIFGVVGMALARRGWKEQSLIYLKFLAFIAVSAAFWAHTSHRTHLDVYLIIFTAFAINRLWSYVNKEPFLVKDVKELGMKDIIVDGTYSRFDSLQAPSASSSAITSTGGVH